LVSTSGQDARDGSGGELPKEWLELGTFGVGWVGAWTPYAREDLIEKM
jgi:hypothetical protein